MRKETVDLNDIQRVKDFAKFCSRFEFDIKVISGPHIVDAKSLLGLFSVDLSKPVTVQVPESALEFVKLLESGNW